MADPKISIVIPVYNVEKYISRCIESMIQQSYKNIEILLINDGSTDGSLTLCEKFAKQDSRIFVYNKENGGVSSARNIGIQNASGDYIMFCDGDDWYDSQLVEDLFGFNRKINDDILFFHYNLVKNGKNIKIFQTKLKEIKENPLDFSLLYLKSSGKMKDSIFYDNSIAIFCWRLAINVAFLKRVGVRFEEQISVGEDRLFLMSLLLHNPSIDVRDDVFGYYYFIRGAESLVGQKDITSYIPDLFLLYNKYDEIEQAICRKNNCLSTKQIRDIRLKRANIMRTQVILNEFKYNRENSVQIIKNYRKIEFFRFAYTWRNLGYLILQKNKSEIIKWLLIKFRLYSFLSAYYGK